MTAYPLSLVSACALLSAIVLKAQPILTHGHADVGVGYEAGIWELHVHDEETDTEHPPDAAVLRLDDGARMRVPDNDGFRFMGEAGSAVWRLPENENAQLLFLGLSGEELPQEVFTGNTIALLLISVDGPGEFWLYHTDAFGTPIVSMNSADGIDATDQRPVTAGLHSHVNWGFSAPGVYRIGLQARGTLIDDGTETVGEVSELVFEVRPAELSEGHMDVKLFYNASIEPALAVELRDSLADIGYGSGGAIIRSGASAEWALPAGTPFGQEGDPLWILPQSSNPDLPFIGLNAEGIPPEAQFTGPLRLQLVAVEGPGDFFLWQSGGGVLDVRMNTRDGIDSNDHAQVPPGAHAHYNWGFTAPGVYLVTLQAVGRRSEASADDVSLEFPLTFHVEPLPVDPAYQAWQRRFWPTHNPPDVRAPGADPDGDDIPNIMEYALGLHPLVAFRDGLPRFAWSDVEGQRHGGLMFTRVKAATDLDYLPGLRSAVSDRDWTEMQAIVEVLDEGATETVTVRDSGDVAVSGPRFYQLRVRFKDE